MSGADQRYESREDADTVEIARQLGLTLVGGSTVLLFGDLGAGKTTFVRGVVEGAGGSADDVSSPTFTLVQPYAGRLTVQHVDLYRLAPSDVDDLGLAELSTPASIVVIEWADRLTRPPTDAICVWIEDLGDDNRAIRIARPAAPE